MDTITVVDVAFGIVTTLLLGALATIEFVSDRRRRGADDTQLALDIRSSLASLEIVGLLAQKSLTPVEKEYLKQAHAIADGRVTAIKTVARLDPLLVESLNSSVDRVFAAIADDPEAQQTQARMAAALGSASRNDRSAFSWNGGARLTKYELLHLIALKFIAEHGITTKTDFEKQFGDVVTSVVGTEVGGKTFTGKRLLDPIDVDRHAKRDADLTNRYGAITFDDKAYRAGWSLGFPVVPDLGRLIQLPVIDHFSTLPGYPITPA